MLNFIVSVVLLVNTSLSGLERPNLTNEKTRARNYQVSGKIKSDSAKIAEAGAYPPIDEGEGLRRAKALVRVINQYRLEQGLNEIPYSSWLTYVARFHVYDLETNDPAGGSCNLHSWSNKGSWSPCCYTDDHARAGCMWKKPKELSAGAYTGTGYEIAAKNSGGMTTYGALEQWKGSRAHRNVILNRGTWADKKWKAIGAAVSNYHAVVWFGD